MSHWLSKMVKGDEKLQQQNPTEPKLIMSGTMKLPTHTIKTILDETKIKNKLRVVMNVSDIIEATASGGGSGAGMMTSSPVGNDSNITLWQFLLELLTSEKHQDIIQWTKCREGEFKLIDAEAVAKLWGQRKAKPHMNYDKLSRALRYYYEKNIIKKVIGQKFVYRFVTPNFNENSTTANSGVEYPVIKPTKIEFKEEKDYETGRFGTTSSRTNFSALSLVNTSSPPSTAHSVATPSPSNSACSPSSSISSSTASLMAGAAHSNSPLPSTSSPNGSSASGAEESPSTNSSGKLTTNRKRSHSPKCSTTSTTATTSSTTTTPSARRSKPNPLNLTAATNFGMQHHPSQTSAGFTAAVAAAAAAAQFSPMMMLHQNSPLLQPALNQLCAIASVASLASAGMYGPQMSPLLAAATSPFRSTLGSTPKGDGTIKTPSTQPQIFQFPPTSAAFSTTSLFNPFSSLISPGAPFMMSSPASNTFKFPSTESLKTPTVPMKMPSL